MKARNYAAIKDRVLEASKLFYRVYILQIQIKNNYFNCNFMTDSK